MTTRRDFVRGAAASTVAALGAGKTLAVTVGNDSEDAGSELAELIRRYWAEVDAFNAGSCGDTDEEALAELDAIYDRTLRRMIGVPVRTAEDALAALDWWERESEHCDLYDEIASGRLYGGVAESIRDAMRAYLAGAVA